VWLAPGNGTYDFHRATAAEEAAFYPRGKTPPRYVYRKPAPRDDGWPVATLEEVGISGDGMAKFIEKVIAAPVDSLHTSDLTLSSSPVTANSCSRNTSTVRVRTSRTTRDRRPRA